jgi:hypothetical protein
MKNTKLNQGYQDGKLSAKFKNPIHNNWRRDKSNKCIHHCKEYLKGYKEGFKEASGLLPYCLC